MAAFISIVKYLNPVVITLFPGRQQPSSLGVEAVELPDPPGKATSDRPAWALATVPTNSCRSSSVMLPRISICASTAQITSGRRAHVVVGKHGI